MKTILSFLLVLFLASSSAQASFFSPIVKLSEKAAARNAAKATARTALHESDDVARIALHNADDIAKAGAKTGSKVVGEATARTAAMVERSVAAERAAARAAAPAVAEIHRTPIRPPTIPPKTVLAGGAAVAGTVAAHNLTAGELEKDKAIADGIRRDPQAAERIASGGFLHMLGAGVGRALVLLAWLLGGGIGLSVLGRAIRIHPIRRPAVIDITPESTSR